jgi:hypothetical protein
MKTLLIILVLWSQVGLGQTSAEWLRQKKTQKKYLLQQIAALRVYGNYLAKGYTIARDGLNVIGGLKQGCYNQDSKFFESLRIASPRVKQYKKVADIISMQVKLSKAVQQMKQYSSDSRQLTTGEISYLQGVFNRVMSECESDLDRLMVVITNTELEMSDDERIKEIDRLYSSTMGRQSFVQSFSNDIKGLVVQRLNEAAEVKKSKLLNGIR